MSKSLYRGKTSLEVIKNMIKILIVVSALWLVIRLRKDYEPYDAKRWNSRRDWYRHSYLKSRHWRKTRNAALARANFKCQSCGANQHLTVHHLTYENLGHEKNSDLKVLCWSCHKREHRKVA